MALLPDDLYLSREVLADPQIQARGMVLEQTHPVVGTVKLPNLPFRFSDCDTTCKVPAPLLGQHNREIATDLGFARDDVDAMVRDGVLYAEAAALLSPRQKILCHRMMLRAAAAWYQAVRTERSTASRVARSPSSCEAAAARLRAVHAFDATVALVGEGGEVQAERGRRPAGEQEPDEPGVAAGGVGGTVLQGNAVALLRNNCKHRYSLCWRKWLFNG